MSAALPPEAIDGGPLRLRPVRREEAALYARWWSDDEVAYGFCSEPRSAESIAAAFDELEAEARDTGHWIDFVIEWEGRPAGLIWLSHWDLDEARCDMNILIGEPELRRTGMARRAVRLLAGWAFPTMSLRRISLYPREDHVPAIRAYLAAGARMGEIAEEVVSWRGETVLFRELYFLPEDVLAGGTGAAAAEH